MIYLRYEGDKIFKKSLFCTPLTTATGTDIFNVVDNFKQKKGINCKNCVSLCTDSDFVMLGAQQELTAQVKQVNPNVQVVHCLLHCENLAAQLCCKIFQQ